MIVTRAENVTRFGLTPEELLADFNLAPGESFGLSDPAIVDRYWNFPVPVDRTVEDGDVLEVGGLDLEVIHLPGHAAGQVGLWNSRSRTLYSADLLHYPSPLGPYPIGNARDHSASIERALKLEPSLLLEGHGLSAYSPDSARRRLLHLKQQQRDTQARIEFVLRREGRPLTIGELLPEVLPVKTDLDYPVSTGVGQRRCYAEACIQTHLYWLIDLGRAARLRANGQVRFVSL
jgi:glyoxylase-like metal-dependent hydrolase (beta-lactamase superfamily II)